MSFEENKAAVLRLHEAIEKRDFTKFSELFTPDYVVHTGQVKNDLDATKQMFLTLTAAFPDYSEKIEHMIAEGDMVAVFYILSGTFKNAFGNTAPTGKKFSVPAAVLAHFKDGKQVEAWQYIDNDEWNRQLGVVSPG